MLGILQNLNYQVCMSMAPSSVYCQGLYSALRALTFNTKSYPTEIPVV